MKDWFTYCKATYERKASKKFGRDLQTLTAVLQLVRDHETHGGIYDPNSMTFGPLYDNIKNMT